MSETKTRDEVITEGTRCPACGSVNTTPKAMNGVEEVDGFDCLVGAWQCDACGLRFQGYEPVAPADWAIVDEDGVVDRFETEAEAREALPEYPEGCAVAHVPDPDPAGLG